ncbi:A24 family peptidase [Rhodoluna sp.]|uniref:prepilin peptidase n=1 Tax=Rhodoluna sp. TaxID=1969481 RepID=UPI0025EFDD63|nr:A24 family peptidase [Rhodoluna sp.]
MNAQFIFAMLLPWLGPAYLLAVAWPLAKTDIREHRLPNRLVLPALPITLLSQLLTAWLEDAWMQALLALGVAAVAFVIGLLLNRLASLGMGDVKLITVIALALGWFSPMSPLVAVFLAFLAASLAVLPLLILRKLSRSKSIALGPYLLGGFSAALALVPFS